MNVLDVHLGTSFYNFGTVNA